MRYFVKCVVAALQHKFHSDAYLLHHKFFKIDACGTRKRAVQVNGRTKSEVVHVTLTKSY